MNIWEAVVLGVVQGLTEFLPVSSSGHLVLLQKIFRISDPTLPFTTAVHVGTLITVLIVLWKDIKGILTRIIQPLTLYLIIATIPTVIVALLFKDEIEAAFETGFFLCPAFLITAVFLLVSDRLYRGGKKSASGNIPIRTHSQMNWRDALLIGLLQAVAIIPGISRSGATISAGLSRRLDRDFVARFSFLLSIPTILGALLFQVKDLLKGDSTESLALLPIVVGTLTSCIVAFFSIRLTIKLVRERSLWGFAAYTSILGILVLTDQIGLRLLS